MASTLRITYELLDWFGTETQLKICEDCITRLKSKSKDNLASLFANAVEDNAKFNQKEQGFVPDTRGAKTGRNPITELMKRSNFINVNTGLDDYVFKYLEREIPHLRAANASKQSEKAWIDYVGITIMDQSPILGEIKYKDDKNAFYAFIQLLTYLSEMATENQKARAIQYSLFGTEVQHIEAFDLHIVLANFNDRGKKKVLIKATYDLATELKRRLRAEHPKAADHVGRILCLSVKTNERHNQIRAIDCLWVVR